MLVGAATQNLSGNDFIALDMACGPFDVRRSYNGSGDFTSTGGVPTSFAASNAALDYSAGYVTMYSFKPDIQRVKSGDLDDEILIFLNSIPAGHRAMLSIWHEADGKARQGTFTVADWKAAFKHFCDLVHSLDDPNLQTALILEAYQPTTDPIGTTYAKMWPGPGYVDVFLVDGYTDLGNTGNAVFGKAASFATLMDVPWGVAEMGQRTGAVDTEWMAEMARYLADHGAVSLVWFNSNAGGVTPTPGPDLVPRAVAETISLLLGDE